MDLNSDEFQNIPPFCNTFSKCVRKGSDLELSGTDAYSGLVLPLIKSLQHFESAESPVDTAWYFDAHLTVGVGVVDAPMIAVLANNNKSDLNLVPWIRVVRHEYFENADKWERDRRWAIDIVHKDYLSIYIDNHLIPFAERFIKKVLHHQTELATSKAFASGMGADSWDKIEQRLQPQPFSKRLKWVAIIFSNIFRFIIGKSSDNYKH